MDAIEVVEPLAGADPTQPSLEVDVAEPLAGSNLARSSAGSDFDEALVGGDLVKPRAGTRLAEPVAGAELTRLLAWFSPSLPIGAYSHSHGLEAAVEAGLVTDAAQLEDYVATAIRFGTGRLDALLVAAAYEAIRRGDDGAADLREIAILAAALRGTSELAMESAAQGRAMLLILQQAWPAEGLERLDALLRDGDVEPAHAVVAGVAAAAHGLPLAATLVAFLHGFVANLVSSGIRLVPLGQTDGQRVTAALEPLVLDVTVEAMAGSIDDLGSAAPMIDLLSMTHESQHTRLFRS